MAELSLSELDAMTIEHAQSLTFAQRDGLLDLIIAEGRHQSTDSVSYRTGLYSDYFDEDLTRMLKVRAIKVLCRGTTSSGFDGVVVGKNVKEQYRAAFRHVQTTLAAAQTGFNRVVTLVVFLTDMDQWPLLNEIYQGGHRHHRLGPKTLDDRNSGVHRLPGRYLISNDSPAKNGKDRRGKWQSLRWHTRSAATAPEFAAGPYATPAIIIGSPTAAVAMRWGLASFSSRE